MQSWNTLKFWRSSIYDNLKEKIKEREKEVRVFPEEKYRLLAYEQTPFVDVKCVILGQDPYPTMGHAHGLAFSVLPDVHPLPPSLRNILKEWSDDLDLPMPASGSLFPWAVNGVLLCNTVLSVEENKPNSHQGFGWEKLTIEAMRCLASRKKTPVVFMLWGKKAQEYQGLIEREGGGAHLIIESSHPSPYSVDKGFYGHRPFSRANEFLNQAHPEGGVNWRL